MRESRPPLGKCSPSQWLVMLLARFLVPMSIETAHVRFLWTNTPFKATINYPYHSKIMTLRQLLGMFSNVVCVNFKNDICASICASINRQWIKGWRIPSIIRENYSPSGVRKWFVRIAWPKSALSRGRLFKTILRKENQLEMGLISRWISLQTQHNTNDGKKHTISNVSQCRVQRKREQFVQSLYVMHIFNKKCIDSRSFLSAGVFANRPWHPASSTSDAEEILAWRWFSCHIHIR